MQIVILRDFLWKKIKILVYYTCISILFKVLVYYTWIKLKKYIKMTNFEV